MKTERGQLARPVQSGESSVDLEQGGENTDILRARSEYAPKATFVRVRGAGGTRLFDRPTAPQSAALGRCRSRTLSRSKSIGLVRNSAAPNSSARCRRSSSP